MHCKICRSTNDGEKKEAATARRSLTCGRQAGRADGRTHTPTDRLSPPGSHAARAPLAGSLARLPSPAARCPSLAVRRSSLCTDHHHRAALAACSSAHSANKRPADSQTAAPTNVYNVNANAQTCCRLRTQCKTASAGRFREHLKTSSHEKLAAAILSHSYTRSINSNEELGAEEQR